MRTQDKAKLQKSIEEWMSKICALETTSIPEECYVDDELTERMTDAAALIFESSMRAQSFQIQNK